MTKAKRNYTTVTPLYKVLSESHRRKEESTAVLSLKGSKALILDY